ncbi:hypothetical protein AKJ16_DCAP04634 [Drosera capensis]
MRWLVSAIFICLINAGISTAAILEEAPISRIAFGSCSNQSAPQIIRKGKDIGPWKNVSRFYPTSEDEMSSKYQKAKNNPGYSRLRNISRRKQAGVYTSYTFGPEGRQIKVIILDRRYHRDPLLSDGTILGSSQWTWLEKEMHGPPTAITIIVSSIQVLSNISATTAPFIQTECWSRFPKERSRLFELIADSKRDGILFISGDVDYGEMARYDCATGYPLYNITSSGLTQSVEGTLPSPLRLVVRFIAWVTPTTVESRLTTSDSMTLEVELRDVKGSAVLGVNMSLSDLQTGKLSLAQAGDFGKYFSREADLPWIVRYRLAILVFNALAVLLLMTIGIAYAAAVISRRWIGKCKHD